MAEEKFIDVVNDGMSPVNSDGELLLPSGLKLHGQQAVTYKAMEQGRNVFLTGGGGTGKSFVINQFVEHNRNKNIMRLAPTNLASRNINGVTINSLFRLGVSSAATKENYINSLDSSPLFQERDLRRFKTICAADTIIIDEISMVDALTFDYMMAVVERANEERRILKKQPIQLIICGDFYQLPPVVLDGDAMNAKSKNKISLVHEIDSDASVMERYCGDRKGYAFLSKSWQNQLRDMLQINLTEIYRQSDATFAANLNALRSGNRDSIEYFGNRVLSELSDNEMMTYEFSKNNMPIICSTNSEVRTENNKYLSDLDGEPVDLTGFISDMTEKQKEHYADDIRAYGPNLEENKLLIKTNARIIFTETVQGCANGQMGTILDYGSVDFEDKATGEIISTYVVKVQMDGETEPKVIRMEQSKIEVYATEEIINADGELDTKLIKQPIGEYNYFPFVLGHAFTVHKTQGQTFPNAVIRFGKVGMQYGQLYVALSRVSDVNQLYLDGTYEYERDNIKYSRVRNWDSFYAETNQYSKLADPVVCAFMRSCEDNVTFKDLGIDAEISMPEQVPNLVISSNSDSKFNSESTPIVTADAYASYFNFPTTNYDDEDDDYDDDYEEDALRGNNNTSYSNAETDVNSQDTVQLDNDVLKTLQVDFKLLHSVYFQLADANIHGVMKSDSAYIQEERAKGNRPSLRVVTTNEYYYELSVVNVSDVRIRNKDDGSVQTYSEFLESVGCNSIEHYLKTNDDRRNFVLEHSDGSPYTAEELIHTVSHDAFAYYLDGSKKNSIDGDMIESHISTYVDVDFVNEIVDNKSQVTESESSIPVDYVESNAKHVHLMKEAKINGFIVDAQSSDVQKIADSLSPENLGDNKLQFKLKEHNDKKIVVKLQIADKTGKLINDLMDVEFDVPDCDDLDDDLKEHDDME